MLKEDFRVFLEAFHDECTDATYVIILWLWNKIIYSSLALNLFLDTLKGRRWRTEYGSEEVDLRHRECMLGYQTSAISRHCPSFILPIPFISVIPFISPPSEYSKK